MEQYEVIRNHEDIQWIVSDEGSLVADNMGNAVLSAARLLPLSSTGQPCGIVVVEVRQSYLKQIFDKKLGESGTIFLMSARSNIALLPAAASDEIVSDAVTMMVLTYDTVNQEAGLVSLPRDTMVDGVKESDGSSFYKLSSAYAYNGIEGLKEEVSQILGIPIDFYVKVSTNGFVKLVDAIGGVDFNVPVNMNYEDYAQDLYIHFNKGMQWLSGSDALKVACCRQNSYYDEAEGEWKTYDAYSDADIGRTETQRNLLTAVLKKALSQPGNFATYYDIFLENVQTDLEMSDLLYFAEKALYFDFSNDLTTSVLPGDSTVIYHGWAYCYELCPDKVLELVNTQGINPYTTDITADMLTIAQKS